MQEIDRTAGIKAVKPATKGSGAWPPEVGVQRVVWNNGNGLANAPLLASATAPHSLPATLYCQASIFSSEQSSAQQQHPPNRLLHLHPLAHPHHTYPRLRNGSIASIPQKWLLCTLSWAARSDRTSYVFHPPSTPEKVVGTQEELG